MKVKIRDQIYDTTIDNIELVLTAKEKKTISKMSSENTKYCSHPSFMRKDEVARFILGEEEDDRPTT